MQKIISILICIVGAQAQAYWACSDIHSSFALTNPLIKTMKAYGETAIDARTKPTKKAEQTIEAANLYLQQPAFDAVKNLLFDPKVDRVHFVSVQFLSSHPTTSHYEIAAKIHLWIQPSLHLQRTQLQISPTVTIWMNKSTGRVDRATIIVESEEASLDSYRIFNPNYVFLDRSYSVYAIANPWARSLSEIGVRFLPGEMIWFENTIRKDPILAQQIESTLHFARALKNKPSPELVRAIYHYWMLGPSLAEFTPPTVWMLTTLMLSPPAQRDLSIIIDTATRSYLQGKPLPLHEIQALIAQKESLAEMPMQLRRVSPSIINSLEPSSFPIDEVRKIRDPLMASIRPEFFENYGDKNQQNAKYARLHDEDIRNWLRLFTSRDFQPYEAAAR